MPKTYRGEVVVRERTCPWCHKGFRVGGAGYPRKRQRFCSVSCRSYYNVRFHKRTKQDLAATEHPTSFDIVWAAGIFEGEGYSRGWNKRGTFTTTSVTVAQKDRWLLDRLRRLFGGHVVEPSGHYKSINQWVVYGPRARGFLMTIYKFLSPRRQEQARIALGVGTRIPPPVLRGVHYSMP